MLTTLKPLLANQFEAAICTLHLCVERCPAAVWNAKVGNYPFSQVAFHTLFFADYYLGPHAEALRKQAFHLENAAFFGDYEQMLPREPTSVYEKPDIEKYLQHCRGKAATVIDAETAESLGAPAAFGKNFSRAELHVYNIRHIQHHAAQLSLRLRLDAQVDIPWVGSGWRDG